MVGVQDGDREGGVSGGVGGRLWCVITNEDVGARFVVPYIILSSDVMDTSPLRSLILFLDGNKS